MTKAIQIILFSFLVTIMVGCRTSYSIAYHQNKLGSSIRQSKCWNCHNTHISSHETFDLNVIYSDTITYKVKTVYLEGNFVGTQGYDQRKLEIIDTNLVGINKSKLRVKYKDHKGHIKSRLIKLK